jgi:cell division GTPase FtsZ
MDGENPTSKALQLAWQGTHRPADSVHKPASRRITIIGAGRTGCHTLTHLASTPARNTQTLAVASNRPCLAATPADHHILLSHPHTANDKAATAAARRQITQALANTDVAIITTRLDDPAGVDTVHLVAAVAHRKGTLTIAVVPEPPQSARGHAQRHRRTVSTLRRAADTLMTINSHQLLATTPYLTSDAATTIVNDAVAYTIHTLVAALAASPHAQLDADDYRTILQQGGATLSSPSDSDPPPPADPAPRATLSSPLANPHLINVTGILNPTADNPKPPTAEAHLDSTLAPLINRWNQETWGAHMDQELAGKLHVTLLMAKANGPPRPRRIGHLAAHLFNMEPRGKPEQPLAVDFHLYQMEDV